MWSPDVMSAIRNIGASSTRHIWPKASSKRTIAIIMTFVPTGSLEKQVLTVMDLASMPAKRTPNTADVFLESEDGTEIVVDHRLLQRSECLKTALDCDAEGADRPLVMVSADVLSAWLAYVQQPDHLHGDMMSVESLEAVLRVRLLSDLPCFNAHVGVPSRCCFGSEMRCVCKP